MRAKEGNELRGGPDYDSDCLTGRPWKYGRAFIAVPGFCDELQFRRHARGAGKKCESRQLHAGTPGHAAGRSEHISTASDLSAVVRFVREMHTLRRTKAEVRSTL